MTTPTSARSRRARAGRSPLATAPWMALLLLASAFVPSVAAGPFIWDDDDDGVDDRMETVNALGYQFSFEAQDTTARQRIEVSRLGGGLVYGVYIVYFDTPTETDLAALTLIGMPVLSRLAAMPVLRSLATYPQVEMAASLPNVERIEAVPLLYPVMRDDAATAAVRDPSEVVFPTWDGRGGGTGDGISVAILDTGLNDAAQGGYPGHQSLAGRFLGGAVILGADSTSHTPKSGSTNPVDQGGEITRTHGTHVGGIVLGTGGPSQYARGVAPAARFVDVKALDDVGIGTAIPEALDWCIANRSRDWGVPGFEGIDVICLALSSLDESDGNDVASRLAALAVELGVVVVASIGNESEFGYCPSPASGDGVLSVAAWDVQKSADPSDDAYADFNNRGPRASDGDFDFDDEMKPDLLAPGVSVLSADGALTSDGAQYRRLSGTSMSAAVVAGAAACLLSESPGLSPAALAELLRATARRNLPSAPAGSPGADARWSSTIGFGLLDLQAAWLELAQPERSQCRRLALAGADSTITATLWTQRERGANHFVFERAEDLAGSPGSFVPVDSVVAMGDSSLADASNLVEYQRVWAVPVHERGGVFWYRVSYTEGGVRYDTPARLFRSPIGAVAATVEVTIVHNAYDNDVEAVIEVGQASSAPGSAGAPALVYSIGGSNTAAAHDWVTGASTTGNVAWTFHIPIPAGEAEAYLPPGPDAIWILRVLEGGFLNRSGRITEFRVVQHGSGGNTETEGGPVPQQTAEGQSVEVLAPFMTTGVPLDPRPNGLGYGPNPVRRGEAVHFSLPRPGRLLLYDVRGRAVGQVNLAPTGENYQGVWQTRRPGFTANPGIYFVRFEQGPAVRLVVVDH